MDVSPSSYLPVFRKVLIFVQRALPSAFRNAAPRELLRAALFVLFLRKQCNFVYPKVEATFYKQTDEMRDVI